MKTQIQPKEKPSNEKLLETGFFSSFDQTQIYFESLGQGGETFILIYGLGCLMNHWHFQIDHFSQSNRVVTFDLRGHHQSQSPTDSKNLRLQDCAEDVLFLMDHLKIQKAHILGHSFGVPIALLFARKHAERALSIGLINGFARNPLDSLLGHFGIQSPFKLLENLYSEKPEEIQKIWSLLVNNPMSALVSGLLGGFNLRHTPIHDIEIYLKGVSQTPLSTFLPLFSDMVKFDSRSWLQEISIPSFVVGGDSDLITPLPFQKELAELLPQSQLTVIPYGSHCSQLDFPDYLNLKLEKFLNENKAP